jgi:hypothetical protein
MIDLKCASPQQQRHDLLQVKLRAAGQCHHDADCQTQTTHLNSPLLLEYRTDVLFQTGA